MLIEKLKQVKKPKVGFEEPNRFRDEVGGSKNITTNKSKDYLLEEALRAYQNSDGSYVFSSYIHVTKVTKLKLDGSFWAQAIRYIPKTPENKN